MNYKKQLCKVVWLTFVTLLGMALSVNVYAQRTTSVSVTVKDAMGVLAGANVAVKGTTIGANTDANGVVTLNSVPSNAVIEISFVGYKTQNISVAGKSSIEVILEEDTNLLDELVVIGYGTVKKRDLTGSVSQVKSKELTQFAVSNPMQALQGRVAGLNLTSNTGDPFGDFNIRIRGTNSIRGDNAPLYIIDGMPASASSVNPYDIESIEVLKDASATAIYGSRGANGVILVTTKSGHSGKTLVNYNFEYGISSLRKQFDMLDDAEYMEMMNLQLVNDGQSAYFTDADISSRRGKGKTYDWQENVYRKAPIQQHNVSVSGGNEKTRFVVSGSAMLRDGIMKNSKYNKYNLRSSIDHDINKYFNLQLKMGYTYSNRMSKSGGVGTNRGAGIASAAFLAPPTIGPFDEDGKYRLLETAYPFMGNSIKNPINLLDSGTNKTEANLIDINTSLTWKPFKGFSFKTSWGMENDDYRNDSYTNSKTIYGTSGASVSFTRNTVAIIENIANYNVTIAEDHSLNVMAGITYQQSVSKGLGGSGTGYLSDATETYNLGSATTPGIPSSSYTKWALMSYLARLNYAYKGKYLLTLSGRYDGSSRYSAGNKWGFFPSGAIAWRVSEEPWLKNNRTISDLKIRAGYGVTGSTAISPYATMNMLNSGVTPAGGKGVVTYFAPSTTYPGDLKWESTSQYDVGVDLAMFNNRLRFTADAYYKLTTDLLNSVYLPTSSGYGSIFKNIGEMSNKGLEFLLEGVIVNTRDWSWTASANLSLNRNRIEKLADGQDLYGSSLNMTFVNGAVNLLREGEPMGVFYVYQSDGYDEKGKFKYVDQDGNGNLNNNDKLILGNPHPKFYGGFSTEVSYKNLSLSMLWSGTYGNDIYCMTMAQFYDFGYGLNVIKDVYNSHWDANNTAEQNSAAKYPKVAMNCNLQHSDLLIHDGSYLRLKNIQLSYTLPLKKEWVNRATLYVSGQNLLTLTKYPGLDPEVNALGSDSAVGIDWHGYPMTKSISFGANIIF